MGVKDKMKIGRDIILISAITFVLFLSTSCNNQKNSSVNSDKGQEILDYMSEEEQFEKSDLVYLITAGDKGKVISIDERVYTFYSFIIDDILKGEEEISSVPLRGNTSDESNVTSSIDEYVTKGLKYKIFLKKKGTYHFTTAGFQSIIRID